MKYFTIVAVALSIIILAGCEKKDDSEELFSKAEGFVKLNMYKEALDIYIELKSREYKIEIVNERIKTVSAKMAEEKLRMETSKVISEIVNDASIQPQTGTGVVTGTQSFKVSRCDESYNDRITQIKNEMKPYQDELNEIEKKLSKIGSEYKVVSVDGGYSFAVPADTPKEKQKEISEGPAREYGTLIARKNEIMTKINKYNQDINNVIEEAKKAGQPSDCIKR